MKLYLIPTEINCNASCPYCITKARPSIKSQYLEPIELVQALTKIPLVEKVEITGGGEPLLNKQIEQLIQLVIDVAPTKLYTNGQIITNYNLSFFNQLEEICFSQAHFDPYINQQIMKVDRNLMSIIPKIQTKTKLSLLLSQIGIKTSDELIKYFQFAKKLGVNKVVVREMFEPDKSTNQSYNNIFKKYFVPINKLLPAIKDSSLFKKKEVNHPNPFYQYQDLEIEFENCGCNLDPNNLIIRSDGKIYQGWQTLKPIEK